MIVAALALIATSTTSPITTSKADLYRLAAEATHAAEAERLVGDRCRGDLADEWSRRAELELEVARLKVDLTSTLPPAPSSPEASAWTAIIGAAAGSVGGGLGGLAVSDRTGLPPAGPVVVGSALGAAAGAALGLAIGAILE